MRFKKKENAYIRRLIPAFLGVCLAGTLTCTIGTPIVMAKAQSGSANAANAENDANGKTATTVSETASDDVSNPVSSSMTDSVNTFALEEEHAPEVEAESAILIDAYSGAILYAKNIHTKEYPASITKILTCLLAQENTEPDDIVTFSKQAVFGIEKGSSNIGIDMNEQLTVRDCMYAAMLDSANEVANGLAEHMGGTNEGFAELMNQKAKELGAMESHFTNPHGLHDENHYTTAYDMAMISRAYFADPLLSEIAGTAWYHIEATPTQKDEIYFINHHHMLADYRKKSQYRKEYTVGGKTGYTDQARNTLVTCAEQDGKRLICVVLRASNPGHYVDTTALLDYGFAYYEKLDPTLILSKQKVEAYVRENLGEGEYSISDQSSILVPAGVKADALSWEFEKRDETHADAVFYWQNREVGALGIDYVPPVIQVEEDHLASLEKLAIEPAEENKEEEPDAIFWWIAGGAAILLLLMGTFVGKGIYAEKQRKRRREAILARHRRERELRTHEADHSDYYDESDFDDYYDESDSDDYYGEEEEWDEESWEEEDPRGRFLAETEDEPEDDFEKPWF